MVNLTGSYYPKTFSFKDSDHSNHSNLEMEAECQTKNLPHLNLNISRTKNGIKKLWKTLEQGRYIEHMDCFHFTQITGKNLQFPFKYWQFSRFTTFSFHSWSSVDADFYISLAYVMSEMKQFFWFQNIPASGGLNRKNMKFWHLNPYYKRSL